MPNTSALREGVPQTQNILYIETGHLDNGSLLINIYIYEVDQRKSGLFFVVSVLLDLVLSQLSFFALSPPLVQSVNQCMNVSAFILR